MLPGASIKGVVKLATVAVFQQTRRLSQLVKSNAKRRLTSLGKDGFYRLDGLAGCWTITVQSDQYPYSTPFEIAVSDSLELTKDFELQEGGQLFRRIMMLVFQSQTPSLTLLIVIVVRGRRFQIL